jgi:Fe-S-cluster containining protein
MNEAFSLGAIVMAPIWEPLFHPSIKALDFPPIVEIDCNNCRMARAGIFPDAIKCCSRTPLMVNFLMGSLLERGEEGHGLTILRQWIEQRQSDPLSSLRSPAVEHRETAYGLPIAACPMLEGGRCSIYLHRPYLCMGFHCYFPNPMLYGFWNSLSSLIALTSICASQYIALQVGLDAKNYRGTWADYLDEEAAWPDGQQLSPALHQRLWDGLGEPIEFYKLCYHYILDHRATICDEIEAFRRQQLLRLLSTEDRLSAELQLALQQAPTDPAPLAPSDQEKERYLRDLILGPDKHRWSFRELEGHVLWFYNQAYPAQHED